MVTSLTLGHLFRYNHLKLRIPEETTKLRERRATMAKKTKKAAPKKTQKKGRKPHKKISSDLTPAKKKDSGVLGHSQ
jgi:hypothetical protein